jgi:hypothetical protein
MKHPKRYCVDCDKEQFLAIRQKAGYSMYHCRECGGEVGRVGDGESRHGKLAVLGLDVRSIPEEMSEGANLLDLALGNPDVLSEEHGIWQPRDIDAQEEREDMVRTFKVALAGLTERQSQVLAAVDLTGSHEKAATYLGIKRVTVTLTLKQIEKKLARHINIGGKEGLKGKQPL